MFGIDFTCSDLKNPLPEADATAILFREVNCDILRVTNPSTELVQKLYYSFWSILQDLISINLIHQDTTKKLSELVLYKAIVMMMEMLDSPELVFYNFETLNSTGALTKTFIL